MIDQPSIDAYMARFELALRRFRLKQQSDIASDLRSHIQEAIDYGKPSADVLASLGAPTALARGYAVELLVDAPTGQGESAASRWLKLIGLVAAGGLVTYVVVVSLGAISAAFLFSGVVLFVVGVLETLGVHLPYVQTNGLNPLLFIALSPVFFAVGWGAGVLLMRYVRFLIRSVRAMLPKRARG